jgi:hypothetical protein
MNCRPGDLAIIVTCPEAPENVGAIVEVICASERCPCGCTDGRTVWFVRTRGRELLGYTTFNLPVYASESNVADAYMRPIRGQTADAVDEMVRLVGPAPMTLTEILRETTS